MVNKNNLKDKKKGQAFSTDLLVVIVVILFGVLFLVAYKVNNSKAGPDIDEFREIVSSESGVIVDELKNQNIIDSENSVEVEKLLQLSLQEIKEQYNIKHDFCIVFEKDGNLVKIDPENNVHGIGSDKIVVNGVPCVSS